MRCVLQRWPSRTAGAAMISGYNWFLIIITVIVSVLAVGVALYLLIVYQHPEDRNQVTAARQTWASIATSVHYISTACVMVCTAEVICMIAHACIHLHAARSMQIGILVRMQLVPLCSASSATQLLLPASGMAAERSGGARHLAGHLDGAAVSIGRRQPLVV